MSVKGFELFGMGNHVAIGLLQQLSQRELLAILSCGLPVKSALVDAGEDVFPHRSYAGDSGK